MRYLDLLGSVGEDQENDPADVKNTATNLDNLGAERVTRAAETGVWDGDFDASVRHFQASNGLDVDGLLFPGGPTQQSINGALGGFGGGDRPMKRAGADTASWPGRDKERTSLGTTLPASRRGAADENLFGGLSPRPASATAARPHSPIMFAAYSGADEDATAPSVMERDERLMARGYRYAPDPMGRVGEGTWYDGFGRLLEEAEVHRLDREAERPSSFARPAALMNPATAHTDARVAPPIFALRGDAEFDPEGTGEFVADGGKAFARELRRVTKPEDFDEPAAYFDVVEALDDDVEGVELAGFRDWLSAAREALRRGLLRTRKLEPRRPPQPPAGEPPLPNAITGRLEYIKDPWVKNAADRLLDGAVVRGWVPKPDKLAAPTEVVKQGGEKAAFKDFAQFLGRSGGTKRDIIVSRDGKSFTYEAADKSMAITYYPAKKGDATNSLLIRLPPAIRKDGRDGNVYIKIRYE